MRAIDADKLKQGLEILCTDEKARISAVTYFAIVGFIDTLPTIEAEPVKHGRWIENSDPGQNINEHYMCSECGCTFHNWANDNFCPNCGAKMDLKENDEDGTF